MFTCIDLRDNGWSALAEAFQNGEEIEGDVLDTMMYEDFEFITENDKSPIVWVEDFYADFEDAGRWDIPRFIILRVGEKFYRIVQTVGLTESQITYFENQVPQQVEPRQETVTRWFDCEDKDGR